MVSSKNNNTHFETDLFDPNIRPWSVEAFWVGIKLGEMVTKELVHLPRSIELELHQGKDFRGGSYSCSGIWNILASPVEYNISGL